MSEDAQINLRDAEIAEQKKDYWNAVHLYKNALLEYNKFSGFLDEKKLCKEKIKELNMKKEFHTHDYQYSLSSEEKQKIDDFINKILKADDIFNAISKELLLVDFELVKKESHENFPASFYFCNTSIQDDRGNLLKEGSSPEKLWNTKVYEIHLNSKMQYLSPLYVSLFQKENFLESFMNFIKSKEIFEEDFCILFDKSLRHILSEDYISALHILVPQFESVLFKIIYSVTSIDVLSSRNQKGEKNQITTSEKIINEDFLRQKEVQELLGVDLCEQINFILYSQLGYKLRHNIAHGYISVNALNFLNTILVIHLYINLLSGVRIVKS